VPILQTLSDAGFEGWLVVEAEQDPARHRPLTQAKRAREYLRAVTGR
jgi:inosose dehydratase